VTLTRGGRDAGDFTGWTIRDGIEEITASGSGGSASGGRDELVKHPITRPWK
jgi:hypothetical protein